MSVIITRGERRCLFRSFLINRFAALAFRRLWTRTSRTKPCWSTARHNQCFLPAIVITTSSRCHLSPSLPTDRFRISLAKCLPTKSHGLMRDDDAAGCQHIFDHSQTERETEIEPNGMGNNGGWKSVATVKRITSDLGHAERSHRSIAVRLTLQCQPDECENYFCNTGYASVKT